MTSQDDNRAGTRPGTGEISDRSVLAGMNIADHGLEQGVAYEVAVEGLRMVIGRYTALIAAHQSRPGADPAVLAEWQRELGEWVQRQRGLDVADAEAITATQHDCAAALARLTDLG